MHPMRALTAPDKNPMSTITEDDGLKLFDKAVKNGGTVPIEDPIVSTIPFRLTPDERPLNAISPEEGTEYFDQACTRSLAQGFLKHLLDFITDHIQPRNFPPHCEPNDPGTRRLHPLFVSGLVCFALGTAAFIYFSYWS
jgi:hypothetical protein